MCIVRLKNRDAGNAGLVGGLEGRQVSQRIGFVERPEQASSREPRTLPRSSTKHQSGSPLPPARELAAVRYLAAAAVLSARCSTGSASLSARWTSAT